MMKEAHGSQIRFARVPRRPGSPQAFRRGRSADSLCPPFHTCAPRTRLQEKSRSESKAPRSQAEGHVFGLGPRFSRPGLVDALGGPHLASKFGIGEALAD